MEPVSKQQNRVEGKVIYLLILVILIQTIYPITTAGPIATIIYQLLYGSLVVAGVIVARDTPRYTFLLALLGGAFIFVGFFYAFNPHIWWLVFVTYGTILPYQLMVIRVLVRYIFSTPVVTRDVLYAASAVYLLLGAVFVPIYGMLETIQPGSFSDGAFNGESFFPWQNFIYYSYATLTTLGYGDVLPISMWARSLASIEAIIGVLYVTILMGRLIGLYAHEAEIL